MDNADRDRLVKLVDDIRAEHKAHRDNIARCRAAHETVAGAEREAEHTWNRLVVLETALTDLVYQRPRPAPSPTMRVNGQVLEDGIAFHRDGHS